MRKSSVGGRPSISGPPLRVRSENTINQRAPSRERASSIGKPYGISKLPVANQRLSSVSTNQFPYVPKSGYD